MNNRIVIGLVAFVILILCSVGGYFYVANQKADPLQQANTAASSDNTNTGSQNSEKKSLKDLIGMGNQMCSFQDEEKNSGTVYVGNGKMRAEMQTMQNGNITKMHTISDGNTFYIWSDNLETGFKMNMSDLGQYKTDTVNTQAVDLEKKVDVDCRSWTVDPSSFTLPDIQFTDMATMMQGVPAIQPSGSNGSNDQCSVCANLSGNEASQCKLALNCQ